MIFYSLHCVESWYLQLVSAGVCGLQVGREGLGQQLQAGRKFL